MWLAAAALRPHSKAANAAFRTPSVPLLSRTLYVQCRTDRKPLFLQTAHTIGNIVPIVVGAHDLRRTCAKLCRKNGGDLEQIKFLLGHSSIQTTERYLGSEQDIEIAVNDNLGL
jgi:integrase